MKNLCSKNKSEDDENRGQAAEGQSGDAFRDKRLIGADRRGNGVSGEDIRWVFVGATVERGWESLIYPSFNLIMDGADMKDVTNITARWDARAPAAAPAGTNWQQFR